MQNSLDADHDYQSWMADPAAGGGCVADPAQDANYQAGQNASVLATAAKTRFVSLWNPMAPAYGQKTYPGDGF